MNKNLLKIGTMLSKNSPTILTGLAVGGLVTTVIFAVRATPKAIGILEEEKYHRSDSDAEYMTYKLPKKDIIKLTYKCYLPAIAMGGLTIACIIGANSINLKRNAALASICSLSEQALKQYESKVVETLGEEKHREIKNAIMKDKIDRNPVDEENIIFTGDGDTLCCEAISGRYFRSDRNAIRSAINDISRDMMSEMWVSLNEVYDALNLSRTKMGDLVGWCIDDGTLKPNFSSQLTDKGLPCLVLDFDTDPKYMNLGC